MKRKARRRSAARPRPSVSRKTIYELPPLELECMKALWELGEGSVRQIRERLEAGARPLAYTTVETIMDRLTRKGAVERRKQGRAHHYTPVYRKADAREQAVSALAEHFFSGSRQALRSYLAGQPVSASSQRKLPQVSAPSSRASAARTARQSAEVESEEAAFDTSLL